MIAFISTDDYTISMSPGVWTANTSYNPPEDEPEKSTVCTQKTWPTLTLTVFFRLLAVSRFALKPSRPAPSRWFAAVPRARSPPATWQGREDSYCTFSFRG
jgi:hypothetical protein